MGVQRHAPAALHPRKTRYSLYRRLGGLQGRPGWVRKISPPPGFVLRTVQPVARRYTHYAIPGHYIYGQLCVCVCKGLQLKDQTTAHWNLSDRNMPSSPHPVSLLRSILPPLFSHCALLYSRKNSARVLLSLLLFFFNFQELPKSEIA